MARKNRKPRSIDTPTTIQQAPEPNRTPFGYRFFGSAETFVYSDERFRPSWEPEQNYRLTAEHRHQLCIHLAAHAAVSSLGGAWVYMLAVPRAGVRSWTITERKQNGLGKIWGVCSTSDFYCPHMTWNQAEQRFVGNRSTWEREIETTYDQLLQEHLHPNPAINCFDPFQNGAPTKDEFFAGHRRVVRAQACGYLAGHIADGITAGMTADDALRLYDRRDTQAVGASDIAIAQGLAELLPPGEYGHVVHVTEEALRRPDVWQAVIRLGCELEQCGLLENDDCEVDIYSILPREQRGWPAAPDQTAMTPTV